MSDGHSTVECVYGTPAILVDGIAHVAFDQQ